jgi:hypothetical protein
VGVGEREARKAKIELRFISLVNEVVRSVKIFFAAL